MTKPRFYFPVITTVVTLGFCVYAITYAQSAFASPMLRSVEKSELNQPIPIPGSYKSGVLRLTDDPSTVLSVSRGVPQYSAADLAPARMAAAARKAQFDAETNRNTDC